MKARFRGWPWVALAACLIAVPAAAKQPKLGSVAALAQALATKLPQAPGETVYIGVPIWEGQGNHYALRREVGDELARALSAADPTDKVITPAEASAMLAKDGFQPPDVYYMLDTVAAGQLVGANAIVITRMQQNRNGLLLKVEAGNAGWLHTYGKLDAMLPDTPQLDALLAQPDAPVVYGIGVYVPGVGGIGQPVCSYCPMPDLLRFGNNAHAHLLMIGFTVEANGSVTGASILVSSGVAAADKSVLRAAKSWRFRPAPGPAGKPVATRMIAQVDLRPLHR